MSEVEFIRYRTSLLVINSPLDVFPLGYMFRKDEGNSSYLYISGGDQPLLDISGGRCCIFNINGGKYV